MQNSALQAAQTILLRNQQQNAYILCCAQQSHISECVVHQNSALLRDAQTGKYMYAASTFAEFEALYAPVKPRDEVLISLVSTAAYAGQIAEYDSTLQVDTYHQLLPPETLPQTNLPGITFGSVTPQIASWVTQVYTHPEITEEFICTKAAKAPNVVAFANSHPVGFYLMHSPAELGPVYVQPQYRASGLAGELFARILPQLAPGQKPVLFINPQNQRSFKWAQRLGCKPTGQQIVWFWRKTV